MRAYTDVFPEPDDEVRAPADSTFVGIGYIHIYPESADQADAIAEAFAERARTMRAAAHLPEPDELERAS